jgi:hypothetical protein
VDFCKISHVIIRLELFLRIGTTTEVEEADQLSRYFWNNGPLLQQTAADAKVWAHLYLLDRRHFIEGSIRVFFISY